MCAHPCFWLGAELVVRVLERDRALEHRRTETDTQHFYKRHLDCFDRQAVLFVDVASLPWSIMLSNLAFTQVLTLSPYRGPRCMTAGCTSRKDSICRHLVNNPHKASCGWTYVRR